MKDAKIPELQKANKSKRAAETKVIIASKFRFRLDSLPVAHLENLIGRGQKC